MRIKFQPMPWAITLILLSATAALTQETAQKPSADDFQTISRVNEQRLLKTLDALETAEKALAALQTEITSRERLSAIDAELLKRKDSIIADQEKLIAILQKQTGKKLSILFGLVKIRY